MDICIVKSQRGLIVDDSLLPEKQANGNVDMMHVDSNGGFIPFDYPM